MSNWLTRKIQESANKAINAAKQVVKPQDNSEKIKKLLKDASLKEDEFNKEKGTIDVFFTNGQTLNSIVNEGGKPTSSRGKYKAYLEKKIKDSRENIKELKNQDKFYRRDFISANPLLSQGNPFWSNWDNWILLAFWIAVLLILGPTSMAIFGLPITNSQQQMLFIMTWITIPLFLLYLLHTFA
jgi:hypothetical protein